MTQRPSERTPLLNHQSHDDVAGPSKTSRVGAWTLSGEADKLLKVIGSSPSTASPRYVPSDQRANLAIHLYALHQLSSSKPGRVSIRAQSRHLERLERLRVRLNDEVEKLLNGQEEILEEELNVEALANEELEIDEILWSSWPAKDDTYLCAMDLLLPPYSQTPPNILYHPVILHSLQQKWIRCPAYPHRDDESATSWLKTVYLHLLLKITPRRVHFLHLLSLLLLYGLILSITIDPSGRASPYEGEEDSNTRSVASAVEILAGVWIFADFCSSFHFKPSIAKLLIMSPLYIAFLTYPFSPQWSFTLSTISIPFLTTLLILPYYPSIPLTFPSLLSLSTLLRQSIHKSLKPIITFSPLLLFMGMIFSWSINRDPWRGFFLSPSPNTINAVNGIFSNDGNEGIPSEPNVAPFQTRFMLFVTLIMILVYALLLAAIKSAHQTPLSSTADNMGAQRQRMDEWEVEYARDVALEARKYFAQAIMNGIGTVRIQHVAVSADEENGSAGEVNGESAHLGRERMDARRVLDPFKVVPIPLNLLFIPLDFACIILIGLNKLGWKASHHWLFKLENLGQACAIFMLGPMCLLLQPLEKLFALSDGSKQHVMH